MKLALQVSATFMPDDGVLRSGVGSVNLYSARRVNGALQSLTGVVPARDDRRPHDAPVRASSLTRRRPSTP